MSAPRSYSPFPGPHYGERVLVRSCNIFGAQNLSGFHRFIPGHRALGLQKLPLVRFHDCAWVCRANAHGLLSAVGAAFDRLKAFLLEGGIVPKGQKG